MNGRGEAIPPRAWPAVRRLPDPRASTATQPLEPLRPRRARARRLRRAPCPEPLLRACSGPGARGRGPRPAPCRSSRNGSQARRAKRSDNACRAPPRRAPRGILSGPPDPTPALAPSPIPRIRVLASSCRRRDSSRGGSGCRRAPQPARPDPFACSRSLRTVCGEARRPRGPPPFAPGPSRAARRGRERLGRHNSRGGAR